MCVSGHRTHHKWNEHRLTNETLNITVIDGENHDVWLFFLIFYRDFWFRYSYTDVFNGFMEFTSKITLLSFT